MKRKSQFSVLVVAMAWVLTAACASAPVQDAPASEPVDHGISNTIRWQTAAEIDNFGFDVYRGPTEEGPFEVLTETPIEGAGTSDVPTQYKFVDDTIEPNTSYFYYVESISIEGVREKFTPVFQSKPKVPAGEEKEDS